MKRAAIANLLNMTSRTVIAKRVNYSLYFILSSIKSNSCLNYVQMLTVNMQTADLLVLVLMKGKETK